MFCILSDYYQIKKYSAIIKKCQEILFSSTEIFDNTNAWTHTSVILTYIPKISLFAFKHDNHIFQSQIYLLFAVQFMSANLWLSVSHFPNHSLVPVICKYFCFSRQFRQGQQKCCSTTISLILCSTCLQSCHKKCASPSSTEPICWGYSHFSLELNVF